MPLLTFLLNDLSSVEIYALRTMHSILSTVEIYVLRCFYIRDLFSYQFHVSSFVSKNNDLAFLDTRWSLYSFDLRTFQFVYLGNQGNARNKKIV